MPLKVVLYVRTCNNMGLKSLSTGDYHYDLALDFMTNCVIWLNKMKLSAPARFEAVGTLLYPGGFDCAVRDSDDASSLA